MPTPSKKAGAAGEPKKLPTTQEEIAAALESGELKMGTRDGIKEKDDTTYELVLVPEWDCVVKVQSLKKGQQNEIMKRATVDEEVDDDLFQMFTVIEGCVDPEFEAADMGELKDKNAKAFNRVLSTIYRLSAMGAWAQEAAEATFREGA